MGASSHKLVRFGVFELDLDSHELRKKGVRIRLQEQPFRLLRALIERAGAVVTREELRDRLWRDDEFVEFDKSLTTSVLKVRQALGDSATSPRYIETLPKLGYRFIAAIDTSRDADGNSSFLKSRRQPLLAVLSAGGITALAAVASLMMREDPGRIEPAEYHLRRLTSDGGLSYQPAMSADGTLVAYSSDRAEEGGLDIWLQQLNGGDPIRLTRLAGDELEPDLSPDSATLVFRKGRSEGGIYVIPTLGGEPRQLAEQGYRPRFSPDGKQVAYWTGKEHVAGHEPSSVYVVAASGGKPERIGYGRSPVWAPDGDRLLYMRRPGVPSAWEQPQWVVVDLDEGRDPVATKAVDALARQSLSGDPHVLAAAAFVPQAWLPGGEVLFSAGSGQALNIWSITVSAATGQVSGAPRRITTGSGEHRFPAATISGRLAFADIRENRDIWLLEGDTNRAEIRERALRATSSLAIDESPELSDDGELLVFASDRSGARQIWAKDLPAGKPRALTAVEGRVRTPILRPDGRRAAFGVRGSIDLRVVNTRDGSIEPLCTGCGGASDWSPSGNLLIQYFNSAAGLQLGLDGAVTLTDFASGRSRVVFRDNQPDWRFAPNEKWLAFHDSSLGGAGIRQVFIAPLPDEGEIVRGDLIAVTDGTDNSFRPDWSPNGDLLYYASDRDGYRCIYAQPLDKDTKRPSGPVREIFHGHDARLSMGVINNVGTIGLSVAGDKIALAMAEVTGEIWVMEPR